MLLRIAIGWHFLYEGLEKVESTRKGSKPFSAEPYLRNATGPLAPYFRGMVPDVNSLAVLDPTRLKAAWAEDVEQLSNFYSFTPAQREKAQAVLRDAENYADIWFQDKETNEKRQKYFAELRKVQKIEQNPRALSFERERAAASRKDLDVSRKELIADLETRGSQLGKDVAAIANDDQRKAAGDFVPPWTSLDWINFATMWGLVAMGVCLILGLFTRLAAFAGAVFLAQIYLSMPPWPGLPPNPMAEGHYFIVNKNLVEMLACLVIASTASGLWIGVDAVLFGRYARRRELARQPVSPQVEARRERFQPAQRPSDADTGPIPLESN